MNGLTEKQSELFNFIREFRGCHGYSPSQQEMANKLGISKTAVQNYLNSMRMKNCITWDYIIPRSVRPVLS
jgi:SOS-response transcriptional repressor LexA